MELEQLLDRLGVAILPGDRVLDLDADEPILDDLPDRSIDAAVRRTRRGPKAALAELTDLGRVLKPGGWAVIRLSTAYAGGTTEAPTAANPAAPSRRELFRGLAGRRSAGVEHQGGPSPVPIEALGATATEAGLEVERIEGSGTAETLVLVRASRDGGSTRASTQASPPSPR